MKSSIQKKMLDDLSKVLEKYKNNNYNSEAVLEILSRSLKRKPGTKEEFFNQISLDPSVIMKEQRKMMDYTLDRLSELTGISKSNLSAMENKKRKIGLNVAKVIASALGINYKALV